MSTPRSAQVLLDLFATQTVVDFAAIQRALAGASVMTAFRYLGQVPYRRSYNLNGRYYALYEPSRFDRFGLWGYKGILFSMDGSLRSTVRRMVLEANAGVCHSELQQRLQVRVHNPLLDLCSKAEIARERLEGFYVYLHPEPSVRRSQLEQRHKQIQTQRLEAEVTDAIVIQVLLVLIRHPGSKRADVVRRLRGHSPPITIQHVRVVFDRYDLDEIEEKRGRLGR